LRRSTAETDTKEKNGERIAAELRRAELPGI